LLQTPAKFPAVCQRACTGARIDYGWRDERANLRTGCRRGQSDKIVIYWEREYSIAMAPERLKLDFMPHRPLLSGMSLNEQRTVAVEGYKVIPDDCGPVRTVGQYGWLIRSPVDCKIRRTADGVKWQAPPILPEERILGYKSFSGTYVDLILNSGYPKLCCGIRSLSQAGGLMMKDAQPLITSRTDVLCVGGIKTQEYKRRPICDGSTMMPSPPTFYCNSPSRRPSSGVIPSASWSRCSSRNNSH
jgi:hypothetical protein